MTEFVGQHAGPERTPEHDRHGDAIPVPVPGTTWEITGTPNAAITATDNTQDGATTIGTPPIRPEVMPGAVEPPRDAARLGRGPRARVGSESGGPPKGSCPAWADGRLRCSAAVFAAGAARSLATAIVGGLAYREPVTTLTAPHPSDAGDRRRATRASRVGWPT